MAKRFRNNADLQTYFTTEERFTTFEDKLNKNQISHTDALELLNNCISYLGTLINRETDSANTMALIQIQKNNEKNKNKLQRLLNNVNGTKSTQLTSKYEDALASAKVIPKCKGFCDISGLINVKRQLKAMFILPLTQPQLYIGHKIFKSLLLYGPPGTGKTQIVHALAAEANADIYSITASTILSAYIGETEKMVETLFRSMKNASKTTIIFIDEIDGLFRKRSDSEQDYNRRLKTEIMCQISNLDENKYAFLICATNCPWDLDSAFLRRFHKRIYIPLPNRSERYQLLEMFTRNTPLHDTTASWDALLDYTEGYSSSDLQELVKNALLKPITELEDSEVWLFIDGNYIPLMNFPHLEFHENIKICTLDKLPENSVKARPVVFNDLIDATSYIKSTVSQIEIVKFTNYICK